MYRDVAMTNMTMNPSYMTAKEVVTSFTSGTEEEGDNMHMYEVLPCEANEKAQEYDGQENAAVNTQYANL